MFEIKGDHVMLLIFGIIVTFLASVLLYAMLKSWVDSIQTKFQIHGLYEAAKKDAEEIRQSRNVWSEQRYEREKIINEVKEAKEAGSLTSRISSLEDRQRQIFSQLDEIKGALSVPHKKNKS
jgi:predicted  nucleic acid-binding Zn-ribbon protein